MENDSSLECAPAAQALRAVDDDSFSDRRASSMAVLPDDILCAIFSRFVGSWQLWVPWAPVGWLPPPPVTPSFLMSPAQGGPNNSRKHAGHPAEKNCSEVLAQEQFNTLRVAVCLVCKRWLRVAQSTPSLWTNLFVASSSALSRVSSCTIFGCGKMTLAQRASIPLSVRQEAQLTPLRDQV